MYVKPNKLYGFGGYLNKFIKSKNLINLQTPTQLFIKECEEKIRFTHISSGAYHGQIAYEIENFHKVFCFGSNTSGQLGLNSIGEEYHSGYVNNLSNFKILKLSCGREHSAILIKDTKGTNKLYTTGNTMLGQLGLGISKNYSKNLDTVNNFKYIDKYTQADLNFNVIDVKCGLDHTVILSDSGDIYTCGWGSDGQLGLGPNHTSDMNVFTKVPIPNSQKIIKFSVKHDCTIVLTDKGKLYSWGNSEYGQACHGRKIDRVLEPLEFNFNHQVKDLATGGNFSLLLTDNGEVFVCGCGSLGLGENKKEALNPTKIPNLSNIEKIFSGGNSAAVLDSNNNLLTWGIGSPLFSRLGFDNHKSIFTPRKLEIDKNLKIENVEMGWQFGLIIGEN